MRKLSTQYNSSHNKLAQIIKTNLLGKKFAPFEISLPNEQPFRFGESEPKFSIKVNDKQGLSAIKHFDQLRFSEAYINEHLDIDGDMWEVVSARSILRDVHPFHTFMRRIMPFFSGQLYTNKHAIADHYEFDNEFFLTFMDSTRCYSQAIFNQDDESLETAQHRKLEFVMNACKLNPGDRVLDVGGGWGAFVEYAGKRGVHVTALTLAHQSQQFLDNLIQQQQLPCQASYGDFYQYHSAEPFDAIVILGVMEHLPDYRAAVRQFEHLLKPGGRIYLDASSFRAKYAKPAFISRYVFPGNHRYFCLHDFLARVSKTDLEIQTIHNDRHSYHLTCLEWAKNLDAASEEIINRWGEKLYRIFRLYLWGSSYAFYCRNMDAYRVVLERPEQ